MSAKKDKVLYISVFLLLILYLLSFVKSSLTKDKREYIKSSMINAKYKESIYQIDLYNIKGNISLKKINDGKNAWWEVSQKDLFFSPADSAKVEKMINKLIKVRNMYKLSDKIYENSAFGLSDSNAFHLKYYFSDGFHDLTFGNQDFSLTGRYIMTDKNTRVYEINNDMDFYLSSNLQSWTEPFLISQQILGKITKSDIQSTKTYSKGRSSSISDIDKLLELRTGGIIPNNFAAENASPDYSLNIEIGNKSQIIINIFPTDKETDFAVETRYINPDKSSKSYWSSISSWTYNKIKEITL